MNWGLNAPTLKLSALCLLFLWKLFYPKSLERIMKACEEMTFKEEREIKVNWSRYRPGVAQRVGRVIALLFHDRGTRRWVSGQQHAPAALYPPERPGTHSTGGWVGPRGSLEGGKSRPHRDSIPDRPACSQSLYQLSYPVHKYEKYKRN